MPTTSEPARPKSGRGGLSKDDPYASFRCPDCGHLSYADEQAGDPCRWCGPACPNHETLIERTRRTEGS